MSQFTLGKCLRCASFLSRPQNTCGRDGARSTAHCMRTAGGAANSARLRDQGMRRSVAQLCMSIE
jgi:hypothetical protein